MAGLAANQQGQLSSRGQPSSGVRISEWRMEGNTERKLRMHLPTCHHEEPSGGMYTGPISRTHSAPPPCFAETPLRHNGKGCTSECGVTPFPDMQD